MAKDVWLVGAGLTLLSQGITAAARSGAKSSRRALRKASPLSSSTTQLTDNLLGRYPVTQVRPRSRGIMRNTSLAAVALLGAALLTPMGTATAAGETCQGQAATIVGTPGAQIVGTEGADVIVTNGGTRVDALGGDDLVCATIQDGVGYNPVFAILGAGADTFTASDGGSHRIFAGTADGTDTEADVIRSSGYGLVTSGMAGRRTPTHRPRLRRSRLERHPDRPGRGVRGYGRHPGRRSANGDVTMHASGTVTGADTALTWTGQFDRLVSLRRPSTGGSRSAARAAPTTSRSRRRRRMTVTSRSAAARTPTSRTPWAERRRGSRATAGATTAARARRPWPGARRPEPFPDDGHPGGRHGLDPRPRLRRPHRGREARRRHRHRPREQDRRHRVPDDHQGEEGPRRPLRRLPVPRSRHVVHAAVRHVQGHDLRRPGNDTLTGSLGNDRLIGGPGKDLVPGRAAGSTCARARSSGSARSASDRVRMSAVGEFLPESAPPGGTLSNGPRDRRCPSPGGADDGLCLGVGRGLPHHQRLRRAGPLAKRPRGAGAEERCTVRTGAASVHDGDCSDPRRPLLRAAGRLETWWTVDDSLGDVRLLRSAAARANLRPGSATAYVVDGKVVGVAAGDRRVPTALAGSHAVFVDSAGLLMTLALGAGLLRVVRSARRSGVRWSDPIAPRHRARPTPRTPPEMVLAAIGSLALCRRSGSDSTRARQW